ncbi:13027_t:CDS:2 [Cetraspora pellucida]|uniref:13027_t:CDS:1 n=1 Tax=Cetraspora pellucida TaxID=1433469 RepID=A0ACA9KV82_9GLOM|nr:13027_t:CDS:2 [Cetraspora pellucida]
MTIEKYIICLDKSSEKEKTQEPKTFVSSSVTQQAKKQYSWVKDQLVDGKVQMFCIWCQEINAKNIFVQDKDARQQNLFSSFTIQYSVTKAKALANLCNLVNFIHLNYNEITYHNPPCTLDLPHFHLEENNDFNSSNEENYATYQNSVAGSKAILVDLKQFCIAKGIDLIHLIHFGSNGASNMAEMYNELGARLKCKNTFISINHCIAHCFYLAAEDALKNLQYFLDYFAIVKGIYTYWSALYKRKNSLQIVQDENNHYEFLSVLNIVDTC